MLLRFTDKDIQASKLPDAGWYLVLIEKADDRAASKGDSVNTWLSGKIIKNDDTGSLAFAGFPTPFPWLINSKMPQFAVPLMNAAFGEDVKEGEGRETSALAGRKVVMFIGHTMFKSKLKTTETGQYRRPKAEDM